MSIEHIPFWPFILILFLSVSALYVRAKKPNSWSLIFKSTYNSRATNQLMREENIMENSHSAILVFVFFLSFALLLFNLQEYTKFTFFYTYPPLIFISILFSLFAIYVGKVALLYLLQLIFEQKELFEEYVIVFMNINIVLGIYLLPISLMYVYSINVSDRALLSISLVFLATSLLLRYIRIFDLGLRRKIKWYNIILYLCTLEILPIILIMTIFKNIGINLNLG